MKASIFNFGQDTLTVEKALALVNGQIKGHITRGVQQKILENQKIVNALLERKDTVYGINTGFGPLCTSLISEEDASILQTNILKSHSVGIGKPISKVLSKLMLILKAHALCMGHSGVSLDLIHRILWHIEEDIVPVVPSQGSVGASGDLAPLSHLFLPLIGEGFVEYNGSVVSTKMVFQRLGMAPLTLRPKEGLALINGTQFMAAHAVKIVDTFENCLDHADLIGAMMVEALLGSSKPFHPAIHELRPFSGNQFVANRISKLLNHSKIVHSHANCTRVQDPYSLRCIPQVHGASRNAFAHLNEIIEIELNSVTDNPVIIDEDLVISGGNFHGQPIALPMDYAAFSAAELGNISDRRIFLSLEGKVKGVPKLLVEDTGLNSGFMLMQYTSAALASENKSLCFPASADSIPTSLGQEDHVSMGSISGRKCLQILGNVEQILAIELLCAAQALDFHRPIHSSEIIGAFHTCIRDRVSHVKQDRIFSEDIQKALQLVRSRHLQKLLRTFEHEKENISA